MVRDIKPKTSAFLCLILILFFFFFIQALDSEADHELVDPDHNPHDIEDLLVDFDDLSDSGPELDTLSVTSTPKPQLR